MIEENVIDTVKTTSGRNLLSIVIIDDNPRSLEYLSNALAENDVAILTAPNGQQGLDLIYAHRPRVVLSDLAMPGMNGLDVLRHVKEFDPTIDVFIMSAHDSGGSPAGALELGATAYLRKPIALSVLRDRVGRLIRSHITKKGDL